MFKVLIVNEEETSRKTIERLLYKKIPAVEIIASTGNFEEAKLILASEALDLLFISSMIEDHLGFELLDPSRLILFKVIFTTTNERFAIRAIKSLSFDYLLQPIEENDFDLLLDYLKKQNIPDRAHKHNRFFRPQEQLSKLALATGRNEIELIDINQIIYCEAKKFYTIFYLDNQEDILVTKNLKEYEKVLPSNFIRIHKSFLVNKNKIKKIVRSDGGYVVMENQKFIPIGQKKELFIRHLVNPSCTTSLS